MGQHKIDNPVGGFHCHHHYLVSIFASFLSCEIGIFTQAKRKEENLNSFRVIVVIFFIIKNFNLKFLKYYLFNIS